MNTFLAQTQPVLLLSIYKPIVMAAAIFGWARMTTYFDRDLRSHSGPHQRWNSIQVIVGMASFGLWLALPQFWIGLIVTAGMVGGAAASYVTYRNRQVPTAEMWTIRPASSTHLKTPTSDWSKYRIASVFTDQYGHTLKTPTGHNSFSQAHYLFEEMIGFVLAKRIEQIDILMNNQNTSMTVHVDGIDYPQRGLGQNYNRNYNSLDRLPQARRRSGRIRQTTKDGNQPTSRHRTGWQSHLGPQNIRIDAGLGNVT